jgi:excisionase family DNA binding protein
MITVKEAAERLNCDPRTVRKAIGQGRLTAKKVGDFMWLVVEDHKFRHFALRPSRWAKERERQQPVGWGAAKKRRKKGEKRI